MRDKIFAALDEWAQIALDSGWCEQWQEGAIFPAEMVFFLAVCDGAGARRLVESGRQDGYSTMILAEYGKRRHVETISLDYESDPDQARSCRTRLGGYSGLQLVKGEAHCLFGKYLLSGKKMAHACLMDGPKGKWAIALLLAASGLKETKIIALHNLDADKRYTGMIRKRAKGPVFYEDLGYDAKGAWTTLRAREREVLGAKGAIRSLDQSTLGVVSADDPGWRKMRRAFIPELFLYQPVLIRMLWRVGAWALAARLYVLSYLLSRRFGLEG
jgi:hypothetical protein